MLIKATDSPVVKRFAHLNDGYSSVPKITLADLSAKIGLILL